MTSSEVSNIPIGRVLLSLPHNIESPVQYRAIPGNLIFKPSQYTHHHHRRAGRLRIGAPIKKAIQS